jgi:hypothetical protein
MTDMERERSAARRPGLYTVAESVALLGAVLLVGRLLYPASPGFVGWTANPLLFAVLAASTRHGLLPGLVTAFVAGAIYLGFLLKTATGYEGIALMDTAQMGVPLLFMGSAWLTGLFTEQRRGDLRRALAAHDHQHLRHQRLSTQFTLLSDEKFIIDRQILSSNESFETTVSLFGHLDDLRPGQFPKRILVVSRRLLGGGDLALYRIVGETGQRVRTAGNDWPEAIPLTDPVIAAALKRKGVVSLPQVKGWLNPDHFQGKPLHVAALLSSRWRRRRLLLLAKDLPMVSFSTLRIRALSAGLQVLSQGLIRAQKTARLQDSARYLTMARTSTRVFFTQSLEAELEAARARSQSVQLMEIRRMPGSTRSRFTVLRKHVRRSVREDVRAGRVVARSMRPGIYHAFCPAGSGYTMAHLVQSVQNAIATLKAEYGEEVELECSITVIELDPTFDATQEEHRVG